jgi:uncharacterized protein (DUF362 family)
MLLTRRTLLQAGAASIALRAPSAVPSSSVAIVRCRDYNQFGTQLSSAFDKIGGIGTLVRGKTVGLKVNLTGSPDQFPVTTDLPFRNNGQSLGALIQLLGKAGAQRVRIIESFFPAKQDLALWARYGFDVDAINKIGPEIVWENTQNLGGYKQYVRLKVPNGGLVYPAYHVNQALVDCDVYVSFAKLKDHATAGVTLSMKNNFGNSPCSLYGGDAGPNGNENPSEVRAKVLHSGKTKAPSGVDPELHPDSPRDPGYRVPRVTVDQIGIRPIDLAIIDGVETIRGGEGPWVPNVQKMTPGLIIVGRNPVCTDSVAMTVMGFDPRADRGTKPFYVGDNHLKLAEQAGLGTTDLSRIEVVGVSVRDAKFDWGPGSTRRLRG